MDAGAGASGSTFQRVAAVEDEGKPASALSENQGACTTAELVGAINAALVGTSGVETATPPHRGSIERALKRWCDAEQLDSDDGASVVVAAAAIRDVALCSEGRRLGARPALEWVLPPPGDKFSAQTCLRVLAGCVSGSFPEALSNFVLGSEDLHPVSFEDPALGSISGVCLIALRFVCSRLISISSLLETYEDHPLLPYLISALDSGVSTLTGAPAGKEGFLLTSAARILAPAEQRACLREAWGGVSSGYLLKIIQRFTDGGDMGAVRKIAGNSDVKRLCFSEDTQITDFLLQWLDEYAINSETPRLREGSSLTPFPPRAALSLLLSQPFDPAQCSRPETAETVVHVLEAVGKEATAAECLQLKFLVRELILAHAIEKGVEPGEAMRAATSMEVGSPANLTDVEKCIVAAILCFVVSRPELCEAYSSMVGALGSGPIEYMLLLTSQILSSLVAGDGCCSIQIAVQKCCFPFAVQLGCEGLQRLDFGTNADCRPREAFLEFVTRCVLDRKAFSKQNLFAGTVLGQLEALCDCLEKGREGVTASARAEEGDRAEPAAEDRVALRLMVDLLHPITLNMYLPAGGQARPGLDLKIVQRFGTAMMRIMKFASAHRVNPPESDVATASEEPWKASLAWTVDVDDGLPLALRIGTIMKEVVLVHALSEGIAAADASRAIFGTRMSPLYPREAQGRAQAGAVPVWVHRLVQECMGSQVVLGTVSADARPAPLLLDPQGPVAAAEMLPASCTPADDAEPPSGGGADGLWGAFEVHCGRSHSHRNGVAGLLEDLACVPRPLRGGVKVQKSELFFAK